MVSKPARSLSFYTNYNVTLSVFSRQDGFKCAKKMPQQGHKAVVSRQNAIVKTVTPFKKKKTPISRIVRKEASGSRQV